MIPDVKKEKLMAFLFKIAVENEDGIFIVQELYKKQVFIGEMVLTPARK